MKYSTSVTINKDINTVVSAMKDKDAAMNWIEGLQSFELIEGEEGERNSKYKMIFQNGTKTSEMIETITAVDFPRSITTVYELGTVWNECVNNFKQDEQVTTYTMETTFKFKGLFRLFAWALKPIFKKETLKGMQHFKDYVETL